MKRLLILTCLLCLCYIHQVSAQTDKQQKRIKFWINPVFPEGEKLDENTEQYISILADQYDAYFRYVKELRCFEVVVDLASASPIEGDSGLQSFELTISFSPSFGYYSIYPMISIVPDSIVPTIENRLVNVVWSFQNKGVRIGRKNPFIRYASITPYKVAGIRGDSFYCDLPIVEDSLSKQQTFPVQVDFSATERGPQCDTLLCGMQSTLEEKKSKDGKKTYYSIVQQIDPAGISCCKGSNTEYFHGDVQLPLNNEITHFEIVRTDQSKTIVPLHIKKVRTKIPEWRIIH